MATASPLLSLPFMALDRDRVDLALRNAVQTKDTHLNELASHLIIAGGKRLRPVLSIAAAQVGNESPVSDEVIQGSIACELVHLGSLYHDDVMDESLTRRGVDTVNARWGNLQAILAGDFMLAKASEVSAALGTEVVTLLAQTIGRLCEDRSKSFVILMMCQGRSRHISSVSKVRLRLCLLHRLVSVQSLLGTIEK